MNERDDEKQADLIDQANQAAELFQRAAISRMRDSMAPERHPNFDGVHCVEADCGVELPEGRLKLGRIRCVDCQLRLEAARRGFQR